MRCNRFSHHGTGHHFSGVTKDGTGQIDHVNILQLGRHFNSLHAANRGTSTTASMAVIGLLFDLLLDIELQLFNAANRLQWLGTAYGAGIYATGIHDRAKDAGCFHDYPK